MEAARAAYPLLAVARLSRRMEVACALPAWRSVIVRSPPPYVNGVLNETSGPQALTVPEA